MNSKFLISLTKSLMIYNDLELKNTLKISNFVNSQIQKMPDYFFFSVKTISVLLDILICVIFFKRFHNIHQIKKLKIISFLKKNYIPFFSLYIRLIESNLLVKYFELNNEK